MSDLTSHVQKPGLGGAAADYQACAASDKFTAQPNSSYILNYVNGATPTGQLKVVDQTSQAPAAATPGAGWADALGSAALGASGKYTVIINNSNRFMDTSNFINLSHTTPTTLTLQIIGPLPAF